METGSEALTTLILALGVNFPALVALIYFINYVLKRDDSRNDRIIAILDQMKETQIKMLAIIEAVGLEKKK